MSDDEKPTDMVFSERAYKVVLALNAEYKCGMEGQPATEIVEFAIQDAVLEEQRRIITVLESFEADIPMASILHYIRGDR